MFRNLTKSTLASFAVVALIAGCFHQDVRNSGVPSDGNEFSNGDWALDEVAPQSIKANHVGPVLLTGKGFAQASEIAFDGLLTVDSARTDANFLSETELELTFTDLGNFNAGQELKAGDYEVSVLNGNLLVGTKPLHVRPNLDRLEYVRTIPEFFRTSGGLMEIWVQPVDTEELVMLPWHEVPSLVTGQLSNQHFQWSNVVLTHTATGNTVTPETEIVRVIYGPRFDGTNTAFAMVIDNSGSMGNNDPDNIRFSAAQNFVDKLSPSSIMETIVFNGNVNVITPFTDDKVLLKADLEQQSQQNPGGGTALWDGIIQGLNDLDALGNTVDNRVVIGLTDGNDSDSSSIPQDIIDLAATMNAQIFLIGLGDGNNLNAQDLIDIADATDGSFFLANNAGALDLIFDQLANFQADSYRVETRLTFNPPLSDTGEYTMSLDILADIDDEIRTNNVTGAKIFVSDF